MELKAYGKSEKGLHLENQDSFLIDLEKSLFAVADGVTISNGDSRLASQAAISALKGFSGDLEKSFEYINRKIKSIKNAGTTTLTAAFVKGSQLLVGHVGDSSLFLVHGKSAEKVTEDDSVEGSNVLSQVLGRGKPVIHLYKTMVKEGDVIILATDGVAKYIEEKEILLALKKNLGNVPNSLIEAARQKKKLYEDDKTVVVVAV